MRMTLLAAALTITAGPASAEWVYRPPQASDDLGSVHVDNTQGQRLDVGCGNGGMISVSIRPDLRVRTGAGEVARLAFHVDGAPAATMPAECADWGCSSVGGWGIADMEALTAALRRGSSVTLTLGQSRLADFTLAGSSAAFQRFAAGLPGGCDGL